MLRPEPEALAWRYLRRELALPNTLWAREVMSDSLTFKLWVFKVAWWRLGKTIRQEMIRVISR